MFQGLRTAIYHVDDIEQAKAWYSNVLGVAPYFDQPFYVGFNAGGYELGLQPREGTPASGEPTVVAYWGVADARESLARLLTLGARPHRTGDLLLLVGQGPGIEALTEVDDRPTDRPVYALPRCLRVARSRLPCDGRTGRTYQDRRCDNPGRCDSRPRDHG